MQTKWAAAVVVSLSVVVGCTDDDASPTGAPAPAHPSLSVGSDQAGPKLIHPPIRQRFGAISIDARGPVVVGKPVTIEVAAQVKLPSNSARLTIQMPEIAEIAFRQRFGADHQGPRTPGPQSAWRGATKKGVLTQSTRVVFPVAGLYTVSAQVTTDDPALDDEGELQNTAGAVAWVYVTSSGGRTIKSFADLYRDREANSAPTPVDTYVAGPQLAIGTNSIPLPVCQDPSNCSPCELDPYSCTPPPGTQPGYFSGTLQYTNQRLGTIGLANANMYIFEEPSGWVSQVQTDESGRFTLQCPAASLRGRVQMVAVARNAYTEVRDVNSPAPPPDLTYYRAQADAAIDKCGTDTGIYMIAKPGQAELFDNITRTAVKSRATFPGFSHARITVLWITGPDETSAYEPQTDQISIHETRAVGTLGLFEAAHEYGHALNQTAMGGIVFQGYTPCDVHNIGGITGYLCAYIEGIADYHAVAVWGNQLPAELFNAIDQDRFSMFTSSLHQPVAAQIEGSVAATLLRIGDGTGPRIVAPSQIYPPLSYNDGASLGHGQIASAIRDCHVTLQDGTKPRADGIDYLVYCLEKAVQQYGPTKVCNFFGFCTWYPATYLATVDPKARDAFSGLRSFVAGRTISQSPAISWSWGAVPARVGWDQAVRNVWVCNLFYCS